MVPRPMFDPTISLSSRRAWFGLAAYMTGVLVVAWLGDYPVRVLGYGMLPILDHYVAVFSPKLAERNTTRQTVPGALV